MATRNRVTITELDPQDDASVKFTLSDSSVEFANALRRVMIADVPTLAIDIVTVQTNSSCLPDEAIVHRLGLLPVDSSRAMEMRNRQDCGCNDVCPNCAALFELNVSCGADYPGGTMIVTQEDVKPVVQHGGREPIQLVTPPDGIGNITIAKLRQGQSIRMKMTAYRGTGKVHAKWSPCATATFRYEPQIKLHPRVQELTMEQKKEIVNSCHKGMFAIDTGGGADSAMFRNRDRDEQEEGDLVVANPSACDFSADAENLVLDFGMRGAIEIGYKEGMYHFTVEGTGVLRATEIVRNAIRVLMERFQILGRECTQLPGMIRQAQQAKQSQNVGAANVTAGAGPQGQGSQPVPSGGYQAGGYFGGVVTSGGAPGGYPGQTAQDVYGNLDLS